MKATVDISVVIPTFGREAVLCETIERILALHPCEILIADQTNEHEPRTRDLLSNWNNQGLIRWLRLNKPSIPGSMNQAVLLASREVVLFVDDDIIPSARLLENHLGAYKLGSDVVAVVGQVLQPGEAPVPLNPSEPFRFNATDRCDISIAIACNFSVKRIAFLEAGGFDENFVLAAYCFETEFAERLLANGGRVLFEPAASIHHLRAPRGGTRAHGHHQRTASPAHSVGHYYHIFLRHNIPGSVGPTLARLRQSLINRHHLFRPWWLPVTIMAEISGFFLAMRLRHQGPNLLPINYLS